MNMQGIPIGWAAIYRDQESKRGIVLSQNHPVKTQLLIKAAPFHNGQRVTDFWNHFIETQKNTSWSFMEIQEGVPPSLSAHVLQQLVVGKTSQCHNLITRELQNEALEVFAKIHRIKKLWVTSNSISDVFKKTLIQVLPCIENYYQDSGLLIDEESWQEWMKTNPEKLPKNYKIANADLQKAKQIQQKLTPIFGSKIMISLKPGAAVKHAARTLLDAATVQTIKQFLKNLKLVSSFEEQKTGKSALM